MEREGGEEKQRERERQDIPAKISGELGYQICLRSAELYMQPPAAAVAVWVRVLKPQIVMSFLHLTRLKWWFFLITRSYHIYHIYYSHVLDFTIVSEWWTDYTLLPRYFSHELCIITSNIYFTNKRNEASECQIWGICHIGKNSYPDAFVPNWEEGVFPLLAHHQCDECLTTSASFILLFSASVMSSPGGAEHIPETTSNLASDQIPHLDHPIVSVILAAWYTLGTSAVPFEQLMAPLNIQYTFGHDHTSEEPGYWSSGTLKLLKQQRESYLSRIV